MRASVSDNFDAPPDNISHTAFWTPLTVCVCKGKFVFLALVLPPNFTAMLELWSAPRYGAAYSKYQHYSNICCISSTPPVFSTEMNL